MNYDLFKQLPNDILKDIYKLSFNKIYKLSYNKVINQINKELIKDSNITSLLDYLYESQLQLRRIYVFTDKWETRLIYNNNRLYDYQKSNYNRYFIYT